MSHSVQLGLSHFRYLSTFRNISRLGRKIHMSWTARLWYYKWSLTSIWGGLKWWRLDVFALVFHSKSRTMFFVFFPQKYWTDSWFNTCAYNDTVGAKALHHPSYWLGEAFIGVPGYWQFSYVGTCHDSLIEISHLVAGSSKSRRVNKTHISFLFLCVPRNAHTHIQIMNPSKISRAIHWSGLCAEWMHSSHNYCGGSHTLHQSIPVSKSPGENSEYVRFPKDIMRFLYLHLRKVKREEHDLQSIKVTSWLIHMSEPRPCRWKRRIQWLQMLARSERRINL